MDIFFESFQKSETNTGSNRGFIMTIINSSFVVSALTFGFILQDNNFWKIYVVSALSLIPFLFIILIRFRKFKDPVCENLKILTTIKKVRANKSIRNIFMAQSLLKFFFSWMVVYLPIYLHDYIGFEWSQISVIFAIMLLPFIIFELPAGKIADRWWGEKELLSAGFIIIGIFTAIIPFIGIASFVLWTIILFMTRIGASLIEITTESYFFKHVKTDDTDIISFFRLTRPLAYIAGPLVAIITLQFLSFQYIFFVLGIIMLFGIKYSFALKDTR
jgi:MFS family permease